MTSATRVVRLFCEHFADWPLWDDEGGSDAADWPQLDAPTVAALEAWVAHWNRHFHWERGWDDGQWRHHAAEGERLRQVVAQQLGPAWSVRLLLDGWSLPAES